MKKNYIIVTILLLFTGTIQAQKDKIKAAEKEMNSGNLQDAVIILKSIEYQIYNSNDDDKALFYYVQGSSLLGLADKNIDEGKNLALASKAFQELIKTESESGKIKYSSQVQGSFKNIKGRLVNSAIKDSKANKYIECGEKLFEAYLLDKKDTINLYYAASAFVSGKDFSSALKHYETLKSMNYSGIGIFYYAINKATQVEDSFLTANERDIFIKAGTHEKPRTEKGQSKRGEIYKNIALIYIQNGEIEKAKKAISDARTKNPEDDSLALSEADLYLESKDYDSYKKLVAVILEKNPNDVNLVFNLGVLSEKANNTAQAETFYSKAITIDPQYIKAYINLSVLKLGGLKTINDDMDKLGTSAQDMKKYNVLKIKRDGIYKSVIPYLKKAVEIDPKDKEISQSLLSVYNALEMTVEYKELKAKLS
ncbi:tetratricopeptide repeat protein [Flavobacterium taihuense]|uniref:Tetratricopeptide repeat protein n=1 Tax=Flavobacterium taihuense TaxID=2857508 RepID=A0ABS6XZV9_9FLAO|nr:tetratricopeptide repeat protein [Flavobacterium taihuense]MBW4362204.1 tetratricopeptide repeat protein [Flavobacterium taihuense]